jgi:hypothetical protein
VRICRLRSQCVGRKEGKRRTEYNAAVPEDEAAEQAEQD